MVDDSPERLGKKIACEYGALPNDDQPTIDIMRSAQSTYVVMQMSRSGSV